MNDNRKSSKRWRSNKSSDKVSDTRETGTNDQRKKSYSKGKYNKKKSFESKKTDVTTGEPFKEFKNSKDGENDVQWYAKNPQLLADNASFSYNAALGSGVDWSASINSSSTASLTVSNTQRYAFPGILALHYANWCGTAYETSFGTTAINIAADNIYSFVRHTNSGHANYDETDLMMYFMAMDSIYSFIAWCRRLYGSARIFSQKNFYYQRMLTEVQGVDYYDLINNLANFRGFINTMAAKASAFAVPASMPIMQRHFFMASNIYKDHDTEKAQLYLFQPEGFHYYEQNTSFISQYAATEQLIFHPFKTWNSATPQLMTVSDIMNYGNSLLRHVLDSEDIGIMSGDVLKAFQGNIFTIPATPEDYVVMPVYNPEVLSQIQNSRALPTAVREKIKTGWPTTWDRLDILQNVNSNLIYAAFMNPNDGSPLQAGISELGDLVDILDPIISVNFEHPTPADTMIATRLSQAWELVYQSTAIPDTTSTWVCKAMGTEIIIDYYLAEITGPNSDTIRTINPTLAVDDGNQFFGSVVVKDYLSLSNFDWHPLTVAAIVKTITATQATITPIGYLGDIDTYRVMTADELEKLDQTALLSLYGVPALGTY